MLSTLTWPLWLVERTRLKTYKCINLPIFLSMICAKACKNSFVFWGSCPLTIFDGFAAKFSPNANDTQSNTFSRYLILPSLSVKLKKKKIIMVNIDVKSKQLLKSSFYHIYVNYNDARESKCNRFGSTNVFIILVPLVIHSIRSSLCT